MRSGKIFPVFSGFYKIYENHPWKKFFVGRDEIRGGESSLKEDFYWQTICATIGTTAGVTMAGISARLFGAAAGISGWNVSNIENLLDLWYTCEIQVGEFLFSGLLISSLGAVMDVAMSVSSAMDEVVRQNAAITRRELFHAGNRRKLRRCSVHADHGTDRKSSSACSTEKQTRSMNQNPSYRLLYTDASNTGEFLKNEISGVLLARQHGKENHWEDVTS